MSSRPSRALDSRSIDETEVRALYRQMLSGWNRRSADAIAELFVEDGEIVGLDGSQFYGQSEIASVHREIFGEHSTGAFVGKVKGVRFVCKDVAVLRGVAGMVMPGEFDFEPARNSIQTLVAVKRDGKWRAASFQNTPAQFHRYPQAAQALTDELRRQL